MNTNMNMNREADARHARRAHTIHLENRERMSVTGINEVESFNEQEVILQSDVGMLTIIGEGINISRLNLEDGQLVLEGMIYAIDYADDEPAHKGGFLRKMFR